MPVRPELHFVVEEPSLDEVTVAAQNINERECKRKSGTRTAAGDHLAVNHDGVAYVIGARVKRFGLFARIGLMVLPWMTPALARTLGAAHMAATHLPDLS